MALESRALCLEKLCPQRGDLTSRKLGVVEGSQQPVDTVSAPLHDCVVSVTYTSPGVRLL